MLPAVRMASPTTGTASVLDSVHHNRGVTKGVLGVSPLPLKFSTCNQFRRADSAAASELREDSVTKPLREDSVTKPYSVLVWRNSP
jgi:hypothetical protein